MDNHRDHAEMQFADAGLALLLELSTESDGELLWEEYASSHCVMPPALDQKCRSQIQKTIHINKRRRNATHILKSVGQLAASLAVVLFLTVSLITSVEALRIPVLNFILKHSPRATAILFQSTATPRQTQLEELCSILKDAVPEGYVLEVEHIYRDEYTVPPTVTSVFVAFQNEDDALLTIHVSPAEGARSVDTENAEVTQMELEGQRALLIEKPPGIQVLWINETQQLVYHVTASTMKKTDFMNYATMLAEETKMSNAGLKE